MFISEVSTWLDISETSIRNYLRDFGEVDGCFSESALVEKGKQRRFTDNDVAVLNWILTQRRDHKLKLLDIRAALVERVKSDEPFDLPPRPEEALEVITRDHHEDVLGVSHRALELALAERDMLRDMLRESGDKYTAELRSLNAEIAQLNRRIGQLEQLVKQLGGDPDSG